MPRGSALAAAVVALAMSGRPTPAKRKLHAEIVRTLAHLRRDRTSTAGERRGRTLAIRGFAVTLRGIESELDFIENDSGNIDAATRDALRADRSRRRGAELLRAAGRVFGLQFGRLHGY
jgi:hypothetical protein